MWILIALISPFSHGIANVFDNYLSNKIFNNVWVLIFFTSCFNALFIPLIFFFERPSIPPIQTVPLLVGVAIIEILYLYPYFKALQNEDTSIVTSLFSLGKIFVPILAYIFLGETLLTRQYIGFLVIIICGGLLTLTRGNRIRINKSFVYMFLCAFLLAVEAILYKLAFNQVSWVTGFTWQAIFSLPLTLCVLFFSEVRKGVKTGLRTFRKTAPFFLTEELLTFFGLTASTFTLSIVPVTFEKSIDSFQPFFTIGFAILLKRLFPDLFKEKIDKQNVLKKVFLFAFTVLGTFMVIA